MNGLVKFFLALTASSPVLLIVGINQFEICKPWTSWTWTPLDMEILDMDALDMVGDSCTYSCCPL